MISPVRAANIILERAAHQGQSLTPLQVMKLVYMAHGVHLANFDQPLLTENVQAWQYGPVVPSLYQAMKRFRNAPVQPARLPTNAWDRSEPSDAERRSLEAVYDTYGRYSGPALSNLTHRPGSPWSAVWRPGVTNLQIPNSLIAQHYKAARAAGVLTAA